MSHHHVAYYKSRNCDVADTIHNMLHDVELTVSVEPPET